MPKVSKTDKKGAPAKKSAPAKKTVDKKSKDIKKAASSASTAASTKVKAVPAAKKNAVPPKVAAKATSLEATKSSNGGSKILDLCLLLDCTGSMSSWI